MTDAVGRRRFLALAAGAFAALAGALPAAAQALLQPRLHLPAQCFAYVGDPARPGTWKLPYRHPDGSVDRKRLPGAINAVLGTYRGRKARIPPEAVPGVLQRLAQAADEIGKLPPRARRPGPAYRRLAAAIGR